jgi:uncharacterized membrane protein
MSEATTAALTGVLITATAVWVGGLVAIAVVARVASDTLDPAARLAFFRGLGRSYGIVGTTALAVAYGTGASLVYGRSWDGRLTAAAVVATALLVVTGSGIAQARRMSRLRRLALDQPDNGELVNRVRRGAGRAGALRALIALLSFALLSLGVILGT